MNNSRRDFFKKAIGAAGAVVAAPALLKSILPTFANAADVKYVVVGQGMAAGVNYVEASGKAKVKKELQVDRSGVKFAQQKCSSCALYTKDAGGDYGKCALFPADYVKGTSWCSSWNKKA